ncbi:hypothetical protein KO527_12715 [Pseudoalteromonas sp. C2R02]|uniref:hypothetical protein n=1 Tax=Pseudoalteromonas sp. C2R02 TaxID=2841565 RepID=UPI001C0A0449|nr:hypothetical protein [Pseudoalteromonas sp. C2R02]MBU2970213.1 hypothetical protein [Pseudoalteromonas sp. C2R02]
MQKQTTALLLQVINLGDKNQISAWAFYELLTYQLVKPNKVNFLKSQKQLLTSWRYLISIMAHFGSDSLEQAQLAYSNTASAFKVKQQSILSLNALNLSEAKMHLDYLAKLPIKNKNALLHALEFCIKHDKTITENETILLYVLSTRLELPSLIIE